MGDYLRAPTPIPSFIPSVIPSLWVWRGCCSLSGRSGMVD